MLFSSGPSRSHFRQVVPPVPLWTIYPGNASPIRGGEGPQKNGSSPSVIFADDAVLSVAVPDINNISR